MPEDWESGNEDYWAGGSDKYYNMEDILFGSTGEVDRHAQDLMWDAIVQGNDSAYDDLVSYMRDVYDIDIEAEWDWEDFAAWYESQ